mmetsp:Transcript_71746/g.210218  ORF Transcript_71746/g.210218 Transcript_71746/m.210218 type:complete len:345 (-) Transcript_71746:736-1770(-)
MHGPVQLLHHQVAAVLGYGMRSVLFPQSGDLHGVAVPLRAPGRGVVLKRGLIARAAALQQAPGQHRGARQLHELGHGRELLRHFREVVRDGLGHADHRVPRVRLLRVDEATLAGHELPRFHAQLAVRHERAVCRDGHAGAADDEPLAGGPALLVLQNVAVIIEDAWKAWEHPVPQAYFLQLIISLEEHLAGNRGGEPRGVELLNLQLPADVVRVLRVQGELRLPARGPERAEHRGQVRNVHGRTRLATGCRRDGDLLRGRVAAHTDLLAARHGHLAYAHGEQRLAVVGHELRAPAEPEVQEVARLDALLQGEHSRIHVVLLGLPSADVAIFTLVLPRPSRVVPL